MPSDKVNHQVRKELGITYYSCDLLVIVYGSTRFEVDTLCFDLIPSRENSC